LLKIRCENCGQVAGWTTDADTATACLHCGIAGQMRPHVVWFGEMPFHMGKIQLELSVCDLFVSIGTSGNVYPAAGFVAEVRGHGRAHTVELNLEPSEGTSMFAEARLGPATELVPAFVRELIGT
jgi:NAD-dependent deacetylase